LDKHDNIRCDWDGEELTEEDAKAPITSSSYKFEDVRAARRSAFRELPDNLEAKDLRAFHSSNQEVSSAYTVKMCRPDAQTWSLSEVLVGEAAVQWKYLACSPEHEKSGTQFFEELVLG